MDNPQLAQLIDATQRYPKPVDNDELQALLGLVQPQIKQMAAVLQAGTPEQMSAGINQIKQAYAQDSSPFSVVNEKTQRREMALPAKLALSQAIASTPNCTMTQRDHAIDILAEVNEHTAPKVAQATTAPVQPTGTLAELTRHLMTHPRPQSDEEMQALLELVMPQFNEVAAFLVSRPERFIKSGVAQVRRTLAGGNSAFGVYVGGKPTMPDICMAAKTAISSAVASQPGCTVAQRALTIDGLAQPWHMLPADDTPTAPKRPGM